MLQEVEDKMDGHCMEKHTDFWEMIRDWIINDYQTPGIKSEVIIDMLISDFVEDVIADALIKNKNPKSVMLLAKEFPIKIHEENKRNAKEDKRNAKVDYLVMAEDTFYLVELKTTNASLNGEQGKRMRNIVIDKYQNMWKFFFDILDDKSKFTRRNQNMKKGERNPTFEYFSNCEPNSKNGSQKYHFIWNRIKEKLPISTINELQYGADDKYHLRIIYLCLCRTKKSDEFIKDNPKNENTDYVFLTDFVPSQEREELWNKINSILQNLVPIAEKYEGNPERKS